MIGKINVDFYEPYPKNPKIAKIFKEIGLADELGSGVRNMYKYTKIYSGGLPKLKEDDIFRTYIPLTEDENVGANVGVNDTQKLILNLIKSNKYITQKEMANKINTTTRTIERNINTLQEKGIIRRVGADKNGFWEIIKK